MGERRSAALFVGFEQRELLHPQKPVRFPRLGRQSANQLQPHAPEGWRRHPVRTGGNQQHVAIVQTERLDARPLELGQRATQLLPLALQRGQASRPASACQLRQAIDVFSRCS